MNLKSEKKKFRIIDNPNPADTGDSPYCLVDPTDQIVRVGNNTNRLADFAFNTLDADEVRHDEDLIKAGSRFT